MIKISSKEAPFKLESLLKYNGFDNPQGLWSYTAARNFFLVLAVQLYRTPKTQTNNAARRVIFH